MNCNDVCMCVVNKQFELLEFVFDSVYCVTRVYCVTCVYCLTRVYCVTCVYCLTRVYCSTH